ncbi:GMC family oxidoreductase, partial [Georgenia sp. 10Sc9-8]|nr:GMC family oxidoreductase [Georgenia halotolerans]
PPLITPRFLRSETDRRTAAALLRRQRDLLATAPLADLVEHEESPGDDVVEDAAVADHVRRTGVGIYHAVGSCAMGPADDDVVDARLRVRGAPGLRVVDASIFPVPPSGGTAAPTMAAAWRAADMLQEEW